MVEDYIERQIDQLGKALRKWLSKIVTLREGGRELDSVANSIKTECDLDFAEVLRQNKNEVIGFLKKKGVAHKNLETIADLMLEFSKFESAAPDRKLRLNQSALEIFEYVETLDTTFSLNRQSKITALKKIIEHLV